MQARLRLERCLGVVRASLAACCVSLSACGGTDDGFGEMENLDQLGQPLVADGFWRVAGGPAVYWLRGISICWVRDPGMLMALRWTTTPQATQSNYTFAQLRSGRVNEGACHYPDHALLKTFDSDWVYWMSSGGFCHVKSQAQLTELGGWSKVLVMLTTRQKADYSEGGGMGAEGVWGINGARFYGGECGDGPLEP